MKKKPEYRTVKSSNQFQTRAEAEEWAKKEKGKYKAAGQSVKLEIDFVEQGSNWKARILVKV